MRYGIFSDVHSNLEALEAVLKAYEQEKVGQYCCVGDIVGYAADPRECVAKVSSLPGTAVAGNHDWAAAGLFPSEYFNSFARQAIAWTKSALSESPGFAYLAALQPVSRNHDLALAHGTLDEPQRFDYMLGFSEAAATFAALGQDNICFVGHTHVAGIIIRDESGGMRWETGGSCRIAKGKKYIVNVGSVGQPRDRDPRAAYCVYDSETSQVRIKRVAYDIRKAAGKIAENGLPVFLGERLLTGT